MGGSHHKNVLKFKNVWIWTDGGGGVRNFQKRLKFKKVWIIQWGRGGVIGCVIKSKNEVWKRALWNQGVLMCGETGSKQKNFFFHFLPTPFFTLEIPWPLYKSKKIVPIMGFMVLKMTGLSPRFQCKNRFWKICIGSKDIGKKVANFCRFAWAAKFGYFLPISQDLVHIFQNRFLRWKCGLKLVVLSTMKPIIGRNYFLTYKGVQEISKWKMG